MDTPDVPVRGFAREERMSLQGLLPLLDHTEEFSALLNELAGRDASGGEPGARRRRIRVAALVPDAANAFVLAATWRAMDVPVLVLTPNPESARRMSDQLAVWCDDDAPFHQFVETENIPFERYVPDAGSAHQRLRALAALSERQRGAQPRRGETVKGQRKTDVNPLNAAPLVIASIQAAGQTTVDRATFERAVHTVRVGERHKPDDLVRRWTQMGYKMEPTVEVPGTASRRGGILDIFPLSLDGPVRIEFFDDEIESIRTFDPETQRSLPQQARAQRKIESVTVVPAHESLPALADEGRVEGMLAGLDFTRCVPETAARLPSSLAAVLKGEQQDDLTFFAGFFNFGSIFDYLPDDALTIVLRPGAVEEAARSVDSRLEALRLTKEGRGDIPTRFPQPNLGWGLLADALNARPRRLELTPWGVDTDLPGGAVKLPFGLQALLATPPAGMLGKGPAAGVGGEADRLGDLLAKARSQGLRTVVLSNHAQRLSEMAAERGIDAKTTLELDTPPAPGEVVMVQGQLREGFMLASAGPGRPGLSLLTDNEVFGISKERRRVRRRPFRHGPAIEQLKPGIFVVHIEHGIARFAGTTVLAGQAGVNGKSANGGEATSSDKREFLVLEYAEGDKLYVPTEHLDRIQLYHSPDDQPPMLTRLGTQEWNRARARAKRATEQLAGELIALYAARAVVEGFPASADTPWQDALEASFPYEETPDQLVTLEVVKKDLESSTPMDRLICGDVGFGKTEIALRAAFKVVQSGRQVGVLVPTTVLAQQHYNTFMERLKPFPARVAMLSRFLSDAEEKAVIKGMAAGEVDICIGTHRMLQRDVSFKNLGLVVIDEEHKFGVTHKERLKRLRSQVDVLTLSATPIPRTLHMSLAGVRDMSTIETPPEERLPIKTYVSEDSGELVREAILRELDRGGQAFVLHNRVKDIEEFAAKIQALVPECAVDIGHGQMPESGLEDVMTRFANRDFDVLVCTTIIESGLDLPNVNTLIIDRADMFGLSQLYQLRGRIGRGANRAYAYLLVPPGKQLTETAEQRLNTILAATELGAGFQIAMRDLEIRGTGNLLGAEQSGQITAVGFDLYTKLLASAVAELKAAAAGGAKDGKTAAAALEFSTVRVDLGMDAHIPEVFVEDLAQRLSVYQRLARIHEPGELDDLREELRDRFGPVPKNVDLLLLMARMRILAERTKIDAVMTTEDKALLTLKEPTGGARAALQKTLGRGVEVGHMQVRVDIDREDPEWTDELLAVLKHIEIFREKMMRTMAAAVPA